MFLQFFVLGATIPILSLYLREYLHFTGVQIGAVLAMSAVAAFVYPLVGALVADRLISARRLYGLCHLAGALLMVTLSLQDRFLPFLLLYLAYMLICGPTSALANVVTFHYLRGERLRFGGIRLWGTLGWIAVAWLFGLWLAGGNGPGGSRLPDALKLSALASTFLGLYAFSLPAIPRRPTGPAGFLPQEALQVMRRGEVLLLSGLAFSVSFLDRFYYFGTAPFLRQLGFSETAIMPAMSLGQMTEVFAMGFLGFLIARFGPQRLLAAGVVMEVGRFALFAAGTSPVWLYAGLCLHGPAFAFFFATGYILLDSHCDSRSRAGVHQLFAILTSGLGSLGGNLAAGRTFDFFSAGGRGPIAFQAFWLVPTVLACLVLLLAWGYARLRTTAPDPGKENPAGPGQP